MHTFETMNGSYANSSEETYIEENKEYILGLYDLYKDDREVEKMLLQKGLSRSQVQRILEITREARAAKRLRQAKRFLLFSISIAIVLWTFYFLAKNAPGAETFGPGKDGKDEFLYKYFIVYREIFYFILFVVSVQAISAVLLLIQRKRQWREFTELKQPNKIV